MNDYLVIWSGLWYVALMTKESQCQHSPLSHRRYYWWWSWMPGWQRGPGPPQPPWTWSGTLSIVKGKTNCHLLQTESRRKARCNRAKSAAASFLFKDTVSAMEVYYTQTKQKVQRVLAYSSISMPVAWLAQVIWNLNENNRWLIDDNTNLMTIISGVNNNNRIK